MQEIYSNSQFAKVRELYSLEDKKFPLIYCVLSGLQRGRVWVDDVMNIKAAFLCHDFGWAQLIGDVNNFFAEDLTKFLFEEELFSSFKLRIFPSKYSEIFSNYCESSERQQFYLKNCSTQYASDIPKDYEIFTLNPENSGQVNQYLGLDFFGRNWPSEEAFYKNSFGYFASHDGVPVSVCYSCATMDRIQEIDILTSKEHQNKGIAKAVCSKFITLCWKNNLLPGWDCFTNNAGSMKLNKALNFIPRDNPYKFLTYNRLLKKNII